MSFFRTIKKENIIDVITNNYTLLSNKIEDLMVDKDLDTLIREQPFEMYQYSVLTLFLRLYARFFTPFPGTKTAFDLPILILNIFATTYPKELKKLKDNQQKVIAVTNPSGGSRKSIRKQTKKTRKSRK